MAKTRQKKVLVSDVTNEKMEAAMADFARADARIQKINATLDVEMTRLREKYQDELARLNAEKEAAGFGRQSQIKKKQPRRVKSNLQTGGKKFIRLAF